MTEVLAHRGRALTPEETEELLRDRLGDHVQRAVVEYGVFTLWLAPEGWLEAVRRCRDERLLAYDLFDSLFGVDARDDGFDVVAVLYSTSTGNRIALRARCDGGREAPSLPSITEVYRGADWMEREAYDMYGIDFPGHPELEPRILTVENFEGWPLRKDFHLASRVAKPWPGVAEPVELDEEGNKIERVRTIGDAPGPYELDKAMAEQAKVVNAPPAPAVEAEESSAEESSAEESSAAASPAEVEPGPERAASGGDTTGEDRPDSDEQQDPAARAKAKAEERRKRQAEARADKARARAEKAQPGEEGEPGPEATGSRTTPPAEPAQPADQTAAAEAPAEEDADVDPRVAARRQRQAEARAARAKARAEKAAGAGPPADDGADAAPVDEQAAAEEQAADDQPGDDQPGADPAAAAKAKAEARRQRQAEVRAARAKARAEQQAEADGEGDA